MKVAVRVHERLLVAQEPELQRVDLVVHVKRFGQRRRPAAQHDSFRDWAPPPRRRRVHPGVLGLGAADHSKYRRGLFGFAAVAAGEARRGSKRVRLVDDDRAPPDAPNVRAEELAHLVRDDDDAGSPSPGC